MILSQINQRLEKLNDIFSLDKIEFSFNAHLAAIAVQNSLLIVATKPLLGDSRILRIDLNLQNSVDDLKFKFKYPITDLFLNPSASIALISTVQDTYFLSASSRKPKVISRLKGVSGIFT